MSTEAMEMGEMRMITAPAYGWLFPRPSTKLAKEDSAAAGCFFGDIGFTKRTEDELKMAAARRGIVKAASWSDFKTCVTVTNRPEDALKVATAPATVTNRPEDALKVAAAPAFAGNQAPVPEPVQPTYEPIYAVNKGPVPAPVPPALRWSKAGGAVKTKVEPVDVAYIKALEARGPRLPSFPHGIPESFLLCPAQSLAEQEFRDATAELAAASKAIYDHKMAILEQYRMYGYANEEVEVDDYEA